MRKGLNSIAIGSKILSLIFDKQLGPGWRQKDRDFWHDFDLKYMVREEDVKDMM